MPLDLVDPPSKIYQDDFSPAKGNALQACVASLFGETLKDVPNFIDLDVGYEQGIREYVTANSKYTVVKQRHQDTAGTDVGKLCILRGKSPRGDFGHVIVARIEQSRRFQMIHDPHPDATFLDTSENYGWCMLFPETESMNHY